MALSITCEKCRHEFTPDDTSVGRQAKCPHCGNDMYVPTPEDQIEEIPLAEEDAHDRQREEALQEERRRIEKAITHDPAGEAGDTAGAPAAGAASATPPRRGPGGRTTIKGVILTYLEAMRDSNFDRAEEAVQLLATRRQDSLGVVDQLATDEMPPPELGDIPPGVYQGFLKTLRNKL